MPPLQNKKITGTTLVEKIALFDFDKYYTPKVRILCHIVMWVALYGLSCWYYYLEGYDTSHPNLPMFFWVVLLYLTAEIFVFYFFFYLIMPCTSYGNRSNLSRIFIFIILIYFCTVLYLILLHFGDFLTIKICNLPHYKEGSFPATRGMKFWGNLPLIALITIPVMIAFSSPSFLIKLLVNGVRSYSAMFKAERKANRLAVEKLQEESKFLRAQLNPHFLFNTFNNLYGLALRKEERLPDIILRLSQIMRYLTYNSGEENVPLAKELAFIKDYVSVEKIRFNDDCIISTDINESGSEGLYIPPLLTFAFIENAFKYGLQSRKNKFLDIKISVVEKIFYFHIVNDKSSVAPVHNNPETNGVGMENVRKRLELLYPDKYQLLVENGENTFGIKLQIKLDG